jgi:eukaryotic-like serine/threonine-protein kinase
MQPSTIGPFQLVRELGRGGMGVVFLARDTRLDRQVAIKALSAPLAQEPDRLARFQREAKVLASLNHPRIAAIYGLEEVAGHLYLVLEFVEGETLGERMRRGRLPVDEALQIARQIADALEAAHEKGIIHRDLKPGNVMLASGDDVKVLDFGLARTADGPGSTISSPVTSDSPTLATFGTPAPVHSPTIPGVILGTAGYMSPEQARGKPVDKRSDIFSFGCVLYEMLTGRRPFDGETIPDVIGATLHQESDLTALPPETPARVRELLVTCLAKDRRNRLHDIADARIALERSLDGREWMQARAAAPQRARSLGWSVAAVAGIALLTAGWLARGALVRPQATAPSQSYRVSTTVPSEPTLGALVGIAPDARFVVYSAQVRSQRDSTKPSGILVVRRLDRDDYEVIDASLGATQAALSPDGRSIAFLAVNSRSGSDKVQLKKIALDDGRPASRAEALCELEIPSFSSLCWSSDREIVLATAWQGSILAVPASGGEPRVVLQEERSTGMDNWGLVMPLVPGKSVLATRWALSGKMIKERTEAIDLATGTRTPLLANAGGTQLVDGDILIARRSPDTLLATRIDLASMQTVGDPVTFSGGGTNSVFFASKNGTLAWTSGSRDLSNRTMLWIDSGGQIQPIGAPPRAYADFYFSPDGTRAVTQLESENDAELQTDLWVHDFDRGTFTRIQTGEPTFPMFCWSPDGQRLVYATISNEAASIWTRRADGSGVPTKLFTSDRNQTLLGPLAWAPDGATIAVMQVGLATGSVDILMLTQPPGSDTWTALPYLDSAAAEELLGFSPDGKWVSFGSNASGRRELYVQRFTGPASGAEDASSSRTQVSTSGAMGGGWWSADGKEIRYFDEDGNALSVAVQAEPRFSVTMPKKLFDIRQHNYRFASFAPDGRLLMVVKGEGERASRIDLILHAIDEIRALLPATE